MIHLPTSMPGWAHLNAKASSTDIHFPIVGSTMISKWQDYRPISCQLSVLKLYATFKCKHSLWITCIVQDISFWFNDGTVWCIKRELYLYAICSSAYNITFIYAWIYCILFFLYWFCYEKLRVCILSFLYTHSAFCKFYCSSLYEYRRRFCFLCTVLVLLDSRYLTVINMLDIIHFLKSSLHGLTWYTNWGLKLCEIGECIALMKIFLYGFCDDRYWDMHISTKVYTKEPHSSSHLLYIFLFYNKYFSKFSYRIENQDLLDFWYILCYISAYSFVL